MNDREPSGGNAQRALRSFVFRGGRLTAAQRQALDEHSARFVIPFRGMPLPLDTAFPVPQPVTVEVGFGMGDTLLPMAQGQPERNFLGIEVYPPGVGRLLMGIAAQGVENLRVVRHDAADVFARGFVADSLERVLILFPDPWPKKRHHKRRLVQAGFMSRVLDALQVGGTVHLATDWQPYAEAMMAVMEALPRSRNVNGAGAYWQHPQREATKFERRGRRLGHGVWDLLFEKV